jgi:hypothetical protein
MLLPLRPGRLSWLEERLLFFKQAARRNSKRRTQSGVRGDSFKRKEYFCSTVEAPAIRTTLLPS